MVVCLATVAGTASEYVHTKSKSSSDASIAFISIFGSVFALAFTSMQPIYPGEVLSNDMRGKGMGVFQLTEGCASFVNTLAVTELMTLGVQVVYRFYVFFVFWDCFELVSFYFFVETKGRTLERLDEIFIAKDPRKAGTARTEIWKRTVIDSTGEKHSSVTGV